MKLYSSVLPALAAIIIPSSLADNIAIAAEEGHIRRLDDNKVCDITVATETVHSDEEHYCCPEVGEGAARKLQGDDFDTLVAHRKLNDCDGGDNFNREDGSLGEDWTDNQSGLAISGNQVVSTRTSSRPLSTYTAQPVSLYAKVEGTFVSSTVLGSGYLVNAIRLGAGGAATPLYLKIQHQSGSSVPFVGCYLGNNGSGGTFGRGFREANNIPDLRGSTFTFEAEVDSGTGQVTLTFSSISTDDSGGVYTRNCGVYSDYLNLGQNAGIGIIQTVSEGVIIDNFNVCPIGPSITGDPHIQTWSGAKYDYHGVCDLVLLQNPGFEDGLGMDIHVRTKQLKQFSYVSSAVLQIGDETLEVMGDLHENLYWINNEANSNLDMGINGYPISYRKVNSKQHEFIVYLGDSKSITMKTFKKFVRVSIKGATKESFGTSRGLLGAYSSGGMVSRDNSTVFKDTNAFGQEWQVLPSDGMLFHDVDGPQAPARCEIPQASNVRRRLGESTIGEEEAEVACARVSPNDFDACVFDVMATSDKDAVGAY